MRISLLLLASMSLYAQEGGGSSTRLPLLRPMRYDENWNAFKGGGTWFERLKNIPLGNDFRFTLGGDVRERVEWFNNEEWGVDKPGTDGYLLQRYMIHGDLRIGSHWRAFGQLRSNFVTWRQGGPRPTDKDVVDFEQASLEYSLNESGAFRLRVGRQEVALGSSRLISIREAPNIRLSFDGVRMSTVQRGWKVDLMALRPVRTRPQGFNDQPDHRTSLWGVYLVSPNKSVAGGTLDLYYLGIDRKRARFDVGAGREQRQSFGVRYARQKEAWDMDWEGVLQLGSFRGGQIRAWTVGTNTGYTLAQFRWRPRIGLKANVTSGDGNRNDNRLGTFNALFPKGNYFSQADVLGPYNLMDLHPSVSFTPHRQLSFYLDLNFFWRYSTQDGLYDVPGNVAVTGVGSDARFAAYATKSGIEYRPNRYLTLESEYQRLISGRFLKDQGRRTAIDFLVFSSTFRF
jgi:hypothetical protein